MTDRIDTAAWRAKLDELSDYDAGLLGDGGRGDIGWWHDYLRAEIGRANDHWRNQSAATLAAALDEIDRLRGALEDIHDGEPEWPDEPEKELIWCRDRARAALSGEGET